MKKTFRDVEVKVVKHEGAKAPVIAISSIPLSGVTKAYDELSLAEWADLVDGIEESVAAHEAEAAAKAEADEAEETAEPETPAEEPAPETKKEKAPRAPKKKAKGKSK